MKNIIYNNQITKINGVETLNFKQHLTRSRRPIAANWQIKNENLNTKNKLVTVFV